MAEGGDQWTPPPERRQTRSAAGPSHRDKVDRLWITNRVYIVERKGNQTKHFEFHGDICLIQFLFKHHKEHLTKPNGLEYENHNGVPCIYISYDNSVEKCIDNVKEWISKFQDVEVKKLELSSGNTEDSLQRSLSYLTPECIDGKADVFLDEGHDCLYIVGFHRTINDIFRKTKAAMKNEEMTKKAEEIVIHLDSKSHGLLLREFGFLDKLGQDFPNDSIHLLDCNTKVIYTGAQNEAEKCRKAIAQFFSGICTETLQMSPVKTKLLSNPRVKTYVNEALQANKILCVWEVVSPGQLLLRCPQKKHIEEAHVKIEENIKEEVFSARDPQHRELSSKKFGLDESQLGKVFVTHINESIHIAATTDVMDHIIRWISTYPVVSGGSEHHRQSAAKESKKLHQRLQVQELDLELWKDLSIADACSKVPERRCTIENNCIVIEALEGDLTKIVEEIKGILDRVKKDKVTVSLQSDCAALLRNKEAEHYVNQELGKKHLRCVWKIGSNGDTVDVYTLPVKEAVNAGKIIGESVSLVSLSKKFTHVKRLLEEKEVMKVPQKHHGKVNIFSKTDDVCLVATADAMKDILPMMKAFHEELNTSVSVLLEMPEGICRFVLERNPKFVKKLQEDFGIELRPTGNKNQIEIFGRRQNIDIAKSVLEKETGEIQSDSETMMFLPNVLATEREQSKFEAVNHCYISVEKEIVAKKPCPSHTWVVSKSPYMMLVPGNITEADVYAVMCPVDRRMNPIGAGKDIMMCVGRSLEQNLHQSLSPPVGKPKSDSWTHISEETGSLRCQNIIYTEFPSQDEKGSMMSTSKSVFVSRIKKTLETADANKVFSLAIPLDFCDIVPEAICMQATVDCLSDIAGHFSHLKEIYLYCDEKEEENARIILNKVTYQKKFFSLDFTPLTKDVTGREKKSPIQLEILPGSLVDQMVDAIVNSTNADLNLDNGFVSKIILGIAGKKIQTECDKKFPNGINVGDIAVTSAGKFQHVNHIFHVVLPYWRPTGNFSLMALELLITKCLIQADEFELQSIAFPVLGTGKLAYPTQLVVKTMCDTINKYGRNRKTNIKTVKIAVFEQATLKTFQIYEKYESFGRCETREIDPPHSLLEARIRTQFTSIQMQVLPFYGCRWRVHALAEFVTASQVLQDPQYKTLKSRNHTKEWITKDSEHYLYIRMLSDTEDKINKGIKEVLKITAEERISSLGFVVTTLQEPTSKKQLGCKEQAKMIKKKVIEVTEGKEDKTGYLQEIKILVKSAEDFHMFLANKESKKSKESGKMEKLYNNFMGKKKCPWKIVRYVKQADMGFKVTVVASKEVLPEVMKFIRSESVGGYYGNNTYHENQTDTRNSGQSTTVGATGGYPGNQTDTRYSGQSTTVGATGGYPGNQTDTRNSGQSTTLGATGGSPGNQTDTRYSGQSTTLGATGGSPGNQTDTRYSGQSTTVGATGSSPGNQTDTRYSGQSTTVGATGGSPGNQTDTRFSGQSTTVGATGGSQGNQTDTRYSGQSTTVGATGGSQGNQTDTRNSGQSTTVGATGGSQGNQTDTRYSGQSTTLGATGGYPGNQMDARYSGQSTTHDAIGGYHGNQSDAKHSLQSTTVGATGGHHGNQNDARDSGQSTTVGATARESGSQLKATMPIKSIQSPHHIQYQQPSMDKQASFQYNDIFDGVEASMNQGLRDVIQREDLLKMQELDANGQILCKDLDCLKNIESTLNGKVNSASAREMEVNHQKEHFKRSSDDFEHVSDINIGMSEETFLAIQFFCRGDRLMQQHSFGYHDGMLQINCKDKDEKDNLETSIESKLKHLEVMNKDDVSFTTAEKPKIRGTIDQIHKDVEGVYCYLLKEDEHSVVHVMAQNYSQLQTAKHKILLGIGRIKQTETRRNRRFDNTTPQQGERTLTESKKFSQSYHGSRASWQPPQPTFGYGSVTPTDFTTAEGLLVKVYSGSILHLDVDCIVNAANGDLQHGGGVARVISDAAGYEFDKESRDYIYSHGPLRVGEVCTTSAGNLKYKGVIHAVGPRWYDYSQDQKRDCLCDLKEAVKNSLEEADFQRYKSIAIPAISSGIFGVPKELCALQYFRAVEEYSSKRGRPSTLTEVHFIDKDIQMCQLIQMTFTKYFPGGHGAGNEDKHNLSSSVKPSTNTMQKFGRSNSLPLDPDTDGTSVDPDPTDPLRNRRLPTPSGQTFEIGNNLTVRVVHGNIVNINADAIVSPENIQCDSTGRIAREIARVAGNDYVENERYEITLTRRKPKLTEVVDTLAGRSQFKYVLHVVAPEWDAATIADQFTYWSNLQKSYDNVFLLVDRKHLDVTSIALPILGTGTVADHPTPIVSISRFIARICKDYAEKTPTKKTFYICNDDAAVILHLKDVFGKSLSGKNETKDGGGQEESHICQNQRSKVTEDCCICIDTITDPKRLSCGHVFCKGCIDQQFKYKPTCPQCGAVHGKITGDQPAGTIDIKTTKWYGRHSSLPGYPGYGIISITYTFPSGKQGPEHPSPGKVYSGITRTAFLPDNDEGRLVCKLLNIAFKRKLVFTIGRSRTTGCDGVVTWNDIHHKTRIDGGPQAFGYPDATYLDRVLDELKAKGVTEESLKDP